MIREAFVTHTDRRFLRLSEVLVHGLARFSSRPVVVFGVDVDVDYDSPNLIKRRIESGGLHIAYLKLRAILESGVEHGVYLDADNVPNQGVDALFAAPPEVGAYPLLPRHPRDLGDEVNGGLMGQLGVQAKSMPYVHSCTLAFAPACREFLAECLAVARDCDRRGDHPPVVDETIVNVLLWKHGATRYLPSCNIPHRFFERYLDGTYADDPEFAARFRGYPYHFHTFHYCKDPERAASMLARLPG
ncbi:MAG TPA: hypothetical protein VGR07_21160 [Thermoanaerobaculia bacterium]|nr:hypothetical protein [Thermoanaerobaculia bacterium]